MLSSRLRSLWWCWYNNSVCCCYNLLYLFTDRCFERMYLNVSFFCIFFLSELLNFAFCRTTNSFWPFVYGSCLRSSFSASFWPLRRSSMRTTKQVPFYFSPFCSNSMSWFVPIHTWKPLEAREHWINKKKNTNPWQFDTIKVVCFLCRF